MFYYSSYVDHYLIVYRFISVPFAPFGAIDVNTTISAFCKLTPFSRNLPTITAILSFLHDFNYHGVHVESYFEAIRYFKKIINYQSEETSCLAYT